MRSIIEVFVFCSFMCMTEVTLFPHLNFSSFPCRILTINCNPIINNPPFFVHIPLHCFFCFQVCAIKAPGFGDNRRANLDDLAILTGGEVIQSSLSEFIVSTFCITV